MIAMLYYIPELLAEVMAHYGGHHQRHIRQCPVLLSPSEHLEKMILASNNRLVFSLAGRAVSSLRLPKTPESPRCQRCATGELEQRYNIALPLLYTNWTKASPLFLCLCLHLSRSGINDTWAPLCHWSAYSPISYPSVRAPRWCYDTGVTIMRNVAHNN
jgi:hypothetical protein